MIERFTLLCCFMGRNITDGLVKAKVNGKGAGCLINRGVKFHKWRGCVFKLHSYDN